MRRASETTEQFCGFCGLPGGSDRPLLGGLGVMICRDCSRQAVRSFDDGVQEAGVAFDGFTEQELVTMLEGVTRQRPQLDRFQVDLVAYMRGRAVSWGAIARGLGVARQSAWERFRDIEDG